MDEDRERLIREIEEIRRNTTLKPYPPGYLEQLETEELKNVYLSHKELQPYYQQDYKKIDSAPKLNFKKEIGIICVIGLLLLIFSGLLTFQEKLSTLSTGPSDKTNAPLLQPVHDFSISYGFRENQTVYIIKNKGDAVNTIMVLLDGADANYSVLVGSLPLPDNKEIGLVIDGFLCDNEQHNITFLFDGSAKTIERNDTCF